MNLEVLQQELIVYLAEEAGVELDVGIVDSLVDGGILDSFDIVALTLFLAEKYQIKISPLEVNLDNFDSVQKIAAFVLRKSG